MNYSESLMIFLRKMVKRIHESKELFSIACLLSVVVSLCFSGEISDFIFNNLAKYEEVAVYGYYELNPDSDNLIRIYDNRYLDQDDSSITNLIFKKKYGNYDFEQMEDSVIYENNVSRGIIRVKEDDAVKRYRYFELEGADSEIHFRLPIYPNTCITLSAKDDRYAAYIKGMDTGCERFVDYENSVGVNTLKVYPYTVRDYGYILFWHIAIYFCVMGLCFLLQSGIYKLYKKIRVYNLWREYNARQLFCVFFLIGMAYGLLCVHFFPDAYEVSETADAYYYMHPAMYDDYGKLSLAVIADHLYTFRGYLSIFVPAIANLVNSVTGINIIHICIAFHSILIAVVFSYSLPQLYRCITAKSFGNDVCIITFLLFFFFWHNYYFFYLADIPAAMFAVMGVSELVRATEEMQYRRLFLAGIYSGISMSYRMAYKFILMGTFLWFVFNIVFSKNANVKNVLSGLGYVAGVVAVCLPQLLINMQRGHISLFPYGSDIYDVHSNSYVGQGTGGYSWNMHKYLFGSTFEDLQLAQVDQAFYTAKVYSLGDILYLMLANPFQFVVSFFKRMFYALCSRMESIYLAGLDRMEGISNIALIISLMLLMNMCIIFFLKGKEMNLGKRIYALILILTFTSVFIQNTSHIERRYDMFFYVLVYFINGYLGVNYIKDGGVRISIGKGVVYCMVLFMGMILYETIRRNF